MACVHQLSLCLCLWICLLFWVTGLLRIALSKLGLSPSPLTSLSRSLSRFFFNLSCSRTNVLGGGACRLFLRFLRWLTSIPQWLAQTSWAFCCRGEKITHKPLPMQKNVLQLKQAIRFNWVHVCALILHEDVTVKCVLALVSLCISPGVLFTLSDDSYTCVCIFPSLGKC